MNYTDKLMKLASLRYSGEDYGRICTEICFLDGVAKGCGRFRDVIEEAADYVLSAPITKERVENAERILSPMAKEAKSYTLLFMAHAHIDMNWMWGMQETAVVATDTMRTMLDLMNEFPDFTFSQSQASVYRIVAETSPDMLEEIKSRVKEGRWEITASHWTEADKNLPDGESLTRQILCAKKYLGELFGLPQDYFCIDFEPDTFGYSANVPEILSDAGVKYLFHFRAKQEGKYLYNFVAPSGKRVLALRSFSGYSNRVDDRAVISTAEFCNMHGVKVCPFVYGVGDHGGGPSRVDIKKDTEIPDISASSDDPFRHMARIFSYGRAVKRAVRNRLYRAGGAFHRLLYLTGGDQARKQRLRGTPERNRGADRHGAHLRGRR